MLHICRTGSEKLSTTLLMVFSMCAVYFLFGHLCFMEADNELHDWKIFSRDESDKNKNICKKPSPFNNQFIEVIVRFLPNLIEK